MDIPTSSTKLIKIGETKLTIGDTVFFFGVINPETKQSEPVQGVPIYVPDTCTTVQKLFETIPKAIVDKMSDYMKHGENIRLEDLYAFQDYCFESSRLYTLDSAGPKIYKITQNNIAFTIQITEVDDDIVSIDYYVDKL